MNIYINGKMVSVKTSNSDNISVHLSVSTEE